MKTIAVYPVIQCSKPRSHLPWQPLLSYLSKLSITCRGEKTSLESVSHLHSPTHGHHLDSCYYHLSSGLLQYFPSGLPAPILIHSASCVLFRGMLHRWHFTYFCNRLIAVLFPCSGLCAPWRQRPSSLAHGYILNTWAHCLVQRGYQNIFVVLMSKWMDSQNWLLLFFISRIFI